MMPPAVLWYAHGGSLVVSCPVCEAKRKESGQPDSEGYLPLSRCPICDLPPVTVRLVNWTGWRAR